MSHPLPHDHLFISYAPEDWALAEWLTLRLTVEGYRVWCSRFPIIGGECYPRDIDQAIRHRTFRFLALLSRASLPRPETIRERALALELARERHMEFLIALTIHELSPQELDWASQEIALISFHERWEIGYGQLLTRLRSVDTPRPLTNGQQIAMEARQFMSSRRSWHTVL